MIKYLGRVLPRSGLDPAAAAALLEDLADRALCSEFEPVTCLEAPEPAEVPRGLLRADGRSVYQRHGGVRYAKRVQLVMEERMVAQARAELLLRDGDASHARELAASALEIFTQSRTRYDITHARVTLSRAALASGQDRLAVQQGALARSAVQVMGYGLLCVLYRRTHTTLPGASTAPWPPTPAATPSACPGKTRLPVPLSARSSSCPPARDGHAARPPNRVG